MNEMNDLEMQLLTWAPRRPSARLKQRLFARPQATAITADRSPAFRLGWLAPATAVLFAMCVLFNQRNNPAITGSSKPGQMVAVILSNQSAAAYLPGSFRRDQNRLPADTFEWTNRSGSTSSIGSLSGSRGIQ